MCAAGPPKAVAPSRRKRVESSRSEARREEVSGLVTRGKLRRPGGFLQSAGLAPTPAPGRITRVYTHDVGLVRYRFDDLRTLLARATPERSGDRLAGLAAGSAEERVAAQMALAELPLRTFLSETVVPYERDDVTRLIVDTHDAAAFAPVAHLTVGGFRDWLLSYDVGEETLAALAPGLTPEMAAAVSKLMRVQDLVLAARKCRVVTRFRTTIGLAGRLATRLQPNHPTDEPRGIAAAILDGLLLGSGDAVIGINPVTDSPSVVQHLLDMVETLRLRHGIPTQSCVLAHVTTTLELMRRGAPVDLVFQSIAGTERANAGFGVTLALLDEAHAAAQALGRSAPGDNVMYFETGQGSALSAGAHEGVDQQTCEARAYAVARRYRPLLVNTVAGFIGPEYLYDGKQILRAGLEDHFCGKLLGLPMGCDICYTNHAEADQDDMDALLTLLGAAGCSYIMGVPGADDVMLNYQSTSFHDALYLREVLGLRPAPEFEAWLEAMGIMADGRRILPGGSQRLLSGAS
jgi:ethanolamine ammonia-lyase large subunit